MYFSGGSTKQPASAVELAMDRAWRACPQCGCISHKRSMIEVGHAKAADYFHGRCFAKYYGLEQFLMLPPEKTAGVTMGDLGFRLMRMLVEERSKQEAA